MSLARLKMKMPWNNSRPRIRGRSTCDRPRQCNGRRPGGREDGVLIAQVNLFRCREANEKTLTLGGIGAVKLTGYIKGRRGYWSLRGRRRRLQGKKTHNKHRPLIGSQGEQSYTGKTSVSIAKSTKAAKRKSPVHALPRHSCPQSLPTMAFRRCNRFDQRPSS